MDKEKRNRDDQDTFIVNENVGRVAGWKRGEFKFNVHGGNTSDVRTSIFSSR